MFKTKCKRCLTNLVVKTIGNTIVKTCYRCGKETRTRLEHE